MKTKNNPNSAVKYDGASFKTKIFKLQRINEKKKQSKMNTIRGTNKYFRCKIKYFVGTCYTRDFDSACFCVVICFFFIPDGHCFCF